MKTSNNFRFRVADIGKYITSSMNLNANRTCEIFEIEEGKELFEFYMDFVNHIFGDMPKGFTNDNFTVSKSLDKYFYIAKETHAKDGFISHEQ